MDAATPTPFDRWSAPWICSTFFVAAILTIVTPVMVPAKASDGDSTTKSISALIERLGSESYAERIQSREELSRIGLAAFDLLRNAQDHPDNEIAIVARQLTARLEIRWSGPGDSARVQELLKEYGSMTVHQRRQKIEELAQFPPEESFASLVRLSRYEPDASLGRQAAITAINEGVIVGTGETQPLSQQQRQTRVTLVESLIGTDVQPASQWLRQYARDLQSGVVNVESWLTLINQLRSSLDRNDATRDASKSASGSISSQEILMLTWAVARRGHASDDPPSVMPLIVEQVDLISPSTHDVMRNATLAINLGFYPAVLAMEKQFEPLFDKSPVLLYAAAEARERSGDEASAAELARRAIAIHPLSEAKPADAPEKPANAPEQDGDKNLLELRAIEDRAESHLDIALLLVDRGLFRWAEQEYRLVIDALPVESTVSAKARLSFATMLTELQRHADIIATLEPLAERIKKDDEVKRALIIAQFAYPLVASRIEYHRGLLAIQNGELALARQSLREAFDRDPTNIDILIQMYRTDGDVPWRTHVMDELQQHIRHAENAVLASQEGPRNGPFATSDDEFANQLNNYAWLVCNTEGDYAKALRYSQLSLKKNPGVAALMDTCARCYFVNGDFEAAVETQRRACREEPYSPTLRRQLDEFEAKWKSVQSGATEGDNQRSEKTATNERDRD